MPTDKSLPNVQQTIKLPNPKEVQVQQQQQTAEQMMQPVDIQRQINRAIASVIEQLNSTYQQPQKDDLERFDFFLS